MAIHLALTHPGIDAVPPVTFSVVVVMTNAVPATAASTVMTFVAMVVA